MKNEQAPAHLPDGKVIGDGKYKITRLIGYGAFGCTYEAEYILMESKVVIKEFFLEASCRRDAQGAVLVGTDSQAPTVARFEECFLAEAREVFRLQHPGIVRVTDIIRENGTSYCVMDYVEGSSLQQIIDSEGKLPEAKAMRYAGQVMDALQHAHANGVLHLNIQPSNILIDHNDNAVLIGFGAWKMTANASVKGTAFVINANSYTPIELTGNAQPTPAADVYSLGATLYTALTGATPPKATDIATGMARLAPLPADVSFATKRAIGSMMQPNLKARPQSIEQARSGLGTMTADSPATQPYMGAQVPQGAPQGAPQPPKGGATKQPTAPLMGTAPLLGTLPITEQPAAKPQAGTLPLSEISKKADKKGTLPLSEINKPADKKGTLPLSEINKQADKKGTLPLSGNIATPPSGGRGGAPKWVLIGVIALVVVGGAVGGWLYHNHQVAEQARQEQMEAEKAVADRYEDLQYRCQKDIEYGNQNNWQPLVSAGLLLDSLKAYAAKHDSLEYYPLDIKGIDKLESVLSEKKAIAKAAWMKHANSLYEIAKAPSVAIEAWLTAALICTDSETKAAVAQFAKDKDCPGAYMAVYKASASAGKLTITYYGMSDQAVKGTPIIYEFDGKTGRSIINIEPGWHTATIDINSTATSGLLALSSNGYTFYNQQLNN